MEGLGSVKRITLESAARSLAVSTKTIQRYIAKGVLTRIKRGARTYLLMTEVEKLKEQLGFGEETNCSEKKSEAGTESAKDKVTIDRERYELLLVELGELRKQNQLYREFGSSLQAALDAVEHMKKCMENLEARLSIVESRQTEEADRSLNAITEKPSKSPQKPWWQK